MACALGAGYARWRKASLGGYTPRWILSGRRDLGTHGLWMGVHSGTEANRVVSTCVCCGMSHQVRSTSFHSSENRTSWRLLVNGFVIYVLTLYISTCHTLLYRSFAQIMQVNGVVQRASGWTCWQILSRGWRCTMCHHVRMPRRMDMRKQR